MTVRLSKFAFGFPFLWRDAPEEIRLTHNAIVDAAKTDKRLQPLARDSLRFIREWLTRAHRKGWKADRLYGADPLNPFGNSWEPGLLFAVRGGRIVDMDETTATVRYANRREMIIKVGITTDLQSWAGNLPDDWAPLVRLDLKGGNSP